jgi:predicted dehydrogenase|tara:strand:+ start:3859 stop:4908 length:1050 start_codon:yes stop_codon:yes gene_type:complete
MGSIKLKQKWQRPSKSLPIIFIGAGGIIRNAHIPAYKNLGLKIEGVYDINNKTAEKLAKDFSIKKIYSSLEDALANKNVIFDIAVPADRLLNIVKSLPTNSFALLQKPMGSNYDEAVKILESCKEKNVIAALNFQLRFSPMMLCLRDAIEKNLLGQIVDIEFHYSYYLPWHLWPFLEDLDRVEIPYNSIHYFDLIRSIFGMPKGVFAYSNSHPKYRNLSDTKTTAILKYSNNMRCALSLNHCFQFGPNKQSANVKVEGTKGAAFITLGSMLNYPNFEKDRFEIKTSKKEWEEISLVGNWFPDAFEGTMSNLQRFIHSEDKTLETSVEDTVKTMKLIDALLKSKDNFYKI